MGRPPAGPRGLSEALRAEARLWAEESCLDQQLPLKVRDRSAVLDIVRLLTGTSGERAEPSLEQQREAA